MAGTRDESVAKGSVMLITRLASTAWRRGYDWSTGSSPHRGKPLNVVTNILKAPKGNIDTISFLIAECEEMVRRRGERTDHQALTDDTTKGHHDGHVPSTVGAIPCA